MFVIVLDVKILIALAKTFFIVHSKSRRADHLECYPLKIIIVVARERLTESDLYVIHPQQGNILRFDNHRHGLRLGGGDGEGGRDDYFGRKLVGDLDGDLCPITPLEMVADESHIHTLTHSVEAPFIEAHRYTVGCGVIVSHRDLVVLVRAVRCRSAARSYRPLSAGRS